MNDNELPPPPPPNVLIPGVIALIGIAMIIAGSFVGAPFWLASIITGVILLIVGSLMAAADKR